MTRPSRGGSPAKLSPYPLSVARKLVVVAGGLRAMVTRRARSTPARSVRSGLVRREVLDLMLIFCRRHLDSVLVQFIDRYNQASPHQGSEQRRPCQPADAVPAADGTGGAPRSPRAASSTKAAGQPNELTEKGLTIQVDGADTNFQSSCHLRDGRFAGSHVGVGRWDAVDVTNPVNSDYIERLTAARPQTGDIELRRRQHTGELMR